MLQALAPQTLAHARLDQQIHRSLFQDSSTHPFLDVLATASLDDDRFDALEMEQMRKNEPGRTGSDDSDLCAMLRFPFPSLLHGFQ